MISRRAFFQAAAALAASGAVPIRRAAAAQALRQTDLLAFEPLGQVTLLHLTDIHAQLMPVYFREPSVNIGVGGARGRPPHLPARVGDRGEGERLADHGDARAAALDHARGLEHRLFPFVGHVAREKRECQLPRQFLDAFLAEGELEMTGHGIGTQQVHTGGHVGAARLQGRPTAVPSVAAVQQQHLILASLCPDRAHQRGDTVEASHFSVFPRQRLEILAGQRVRLR